MTLQETFQEIPWTVWDHCMTRHTLSHPMTSRQSLHCTPGFHVSMLEPAFPNTIPNQVQPPPPPVNDEPKFEISEILDTKINNCRHACKLLYLVHWTGYEGTDEETSWILASELGHASKLIMEFHTKYPVAAAKLCPLSKISWLQFSYVHIFSMFKLIHFSIYSAKVIETKTQVSAFDKKDSAFDKEFYLRHKSK